MAERLGPHRHELLGDLVRLLTVGLRSACVCLLAGCSSRRRGGSGGRRRGPSPRCRFPCFEGPFDRGWSRSRIDICGSVLFSGSDGSGMEPLDWNHWSLTRFKIFRPPPGRTAHLRRVLVLILRQLSLEIEPKHQHRTPPRLHHARCAVRPPLSPSTPYAQQLRLRLEQTHVHSSCGPRVNGAV